MGSGAVVARHNKQSKRHHQLFSHSQQSKHAPTSTRVVCALSHEHIARLPLELTSSLALQEV
jgi:hypothetical protein